MASCSVTYTSDSATFTIKGLTIGSSIRLFVRESYGNQTTIIDNEFDNIVATSSTMDLEYNGVFSPDTSYTYNVKVDSTWIGAKTFVTDSEEITPTVWTDTWGDFGTVTEESRKLLYMEPMYIAIYPVEFEESGTATFYSTGNYDLYGYLCSDYDYIDWLGEPRYVIDSDTTGGNFSFTSDVTAGTQYYLLVRHSTGEIAISSYIYVSPPTVGRGFVYIHDGIQWVKATPYVYDGYSWCVATPYIHDGISWKFTT